MFAALPPANDELPSATEASWLPLPLPSRDELAMLRAAGATEHSLRDVRAFWVTFRRGFFDLAKHPGDGERAFLVPIRDTFEQVVDIGAWRATDPREIAMFGSAGVMLGEQHVGNPASYSRGRALPVFRSATTWLARDCRGIVIADAARAGGRLADVPRIMAEDVDHARELGRILAPAVGPDRILAPRARSRAA